MRNPRSRYALPVTSQHRRTLSNTSRKEGIWDEDEEVPQPAPVKRGGHPVQQPQGARARPAAHRDIGHLLRSRVQTKQTTESFARIEKRFNQLPSHVALVDLFIQLKYKHIDDTISECEKNLQYLDDQWDLLGYPMLKRIANVLVPLLHRVLQADKHIKTIDHDFCALVFTQTPKWMQKLEKLDKTIQLWQQDIRNSAIALLESRVFASELSITRLENTFDDRFLRPQKSAITRVDRVVDRIDQLKIVYDELKRKFRRSNETRSNEIPALCRELAQNDNISPEERFAFRNHGDVLYRSTELLDAASHIWRSTWREKWKADNGFLESQLWTLKDLTSSFPFINPSDVFTNLVLSSADSEVPSIVTNDQINISTHLQRLYIPFWKSSAARSPELHIHWRQLDIIGPILRFDLLTWRLSNETRYLQSTLRGNFGTLWSWVSPDRADEVANLLALRCSELITFRAELREITFELEQLTWLRLKSESRLHSMKMPAHLTGRFEVINPLSQDLIRFTTWTRQIAQLTAEAWLSQLARRTELGPPFWEELYDTFESVHDNPSLALGLSQPKRKMIRDRTLAHTSILRDRTRWRSANLGPRSQNLIPESFQEELWTLWVESVLRKISYSSVSIENEQIDISIEKPLGRFRLALESGTMDSRAMESSSPKMYSQFGESFKSDWLKFKELATKNWEIWAELEGSQVTGDPSLRRPENGPKRQSLKQLLAHSWSIEQNGKFLKTRAQIFAEEQVELALDSWNDPKERLALEKQYGPRPILDISDDNTRYLQFLKTTDELWTIQPDSTDLAALKRDAFNNWLDFKHFEFGRNKYCRVHPEGVTSKAWLRYVMKAWAQRHPPLCKAISDANQSKNYSHAVKPLREKQENQSILGPSPSPTAEKSTAKLKFKKPYGNGPHSKTTTAKLKPHELAQRVQSILEEDANDQSEDIPPTQMKHSSDADTSSQAAKIKSLTSDQVNDNLSANPNEQNKVQVKNSLPGISPKIISRLPPRNRQVPRKSKSANVSAGKNWQGRSSASVLGHQPLSKNLRGYTTDANSHRVDCQQIRDTSHEPLSEQPLADETPPVTSTEARSVWEIDSVDKSAPSSDAVSEANDLTSPLFWSHSSQQSPDGQKPIVHYCRTLRTTEETIQHFLGSKVIGFDMEWKSSASSWDSIQNNVSLIQIANEERIALFHVALFKPSRTLSDLVAPSLKRLIESPDVTKVGVSIKADCTRLRKYLHIDAKATFELSHLFKLIKYGKDSPKLVNKRGVNLSDQMEEHFGLPLDKSEDIRCGDWARALTYRQVQCE